MMKDKVKIQMSIENLKKEYPGQFDTKGNFKGSAKLLLRDDIEPSIDPPRKCSIHIKDDLKQELDKMVEQNVIRKIEEHTDWCSSITPPRKKDGSLRICLDPQKFQQAVQAAPTLQFYTQQMQLTWKLMRL